MSAAFIQNIEGPIDDLLTPLENTLADVSISFGVTMLPHMRDFRVVGPTKVTGVSDTPSRARIFTCRPTSAAEEETCALSIVKRLTGQAYRGDPTAEDLQDAMKFYEQGREKGGFEGGVRMALQSILMSPRFLFRVETMPAAATAPGLPRVGHRRGLAAVVLPVGHGRRMPNCCARPAPARLRTQRGFREAGQAHAGRLARRARSPTGSPRSGCASRTSRRSSPTT